MLTESSTIRKRVAIVTTRFPYPVVGGDRLRISKLAEQLSRNYELTLVSLCDSDEEMSFIEENQTVFSKVIRIRRVRLISWLWCLTFPFVSSPLQVLYYKSRALRRVLKGLEQDVDAFVFHLVRLDYFRDYLTKPVILEMTDAISMNYRRLDRGGGGLFFDFRSLIYRLEVSRLERLEAASKKRYSSISLVSHVDRKHIEELAPRAKGGAIVVVAPNGVEVKNFEFRSSRCGTEIIFIGNMVSYQNLEAMYFFASEVLPRIREKIQSASIKVVGRVPRDVLLKLSKFPGVFFSGEVASVGQAAESGVIGVCPVRVGAGVQNKVLEYMALGLPVVTTKIGAEGIDGVPGKDYVVADDPRQFADVCVALLLDPLRRRALAASGRKLIEQNYSWERQLAPFMAMVRDSLDNAHESR